MGSNEDKQRWVVEKVETCVAGVKRQEEFAKLFPHTDYAGLIISLHKEWQFLQ